MAQLNNMITNGKLKVTGTLYTKTLQINTINITLNTTTIAATTGTASPGNGLCTAAQVVTYINTLRNS